jgi:hypothetical protein
MIGRAVKAGVPFAWVTGDEAMAAILICGMAGDRGDPVRACGRVQTMIATKAGAKRADELAGLVPAGAWERLSCADGSKGPRLYDWALVAADSDDHWLLVRRSLQPGEKTILSWPFTAATVRGR